MSHVLFITINKQIYHNLPSLSFNSIKYFSKKSCIISHSRPGVRGIRRNITRSDDIPEGLCPEGNINNEGNISPNPLSGRSINDILYWKLKASKLRIKNLTHTFMNTMFYFRINASIVAFLSDHISFGILMTTFFKICFKILKVYTKGKQGDDRGDLSRLSPQNLWELQCFVSGFWEKGGGGISVIY